MPAHLLIDFMSVAANGAAYPARRVVFAAIKDVGDVVQGGLCMTRVSLYI